TYDPARALPLTATDPNARTPTEAHDALDRATSVWLPGQATTASADKKFAYTLARVAHGRAVPPTVTTSTLLADGSYSAALDTMDGEGRPVQSQSPPAHPAYKARLLPSPV
ncbi:hypothetical protein VM98_36765, partial [Streptomyces rubellomurinus subsp. indigoferus]